MKIWDEASAALLANREVLLAVLGVFSILPNFALQMLAPVPEPVSGQPAAQLLDQLGGYFDAYWLPLIAIVAVQFFGMLVTLALLADPARPTVGEAMRSAARGTPTFLAALVLAFAGSFLTGLIPVILIGLSGSLALTQVGAVMGAGFFGKLSDYGPTAICSDDRIFIISSTDLDQFATHHFE